MVAGATLAEARASLQDKGYGTDTVAAQNGAINAAYRSILSSRRWPFLEKTATLATVAGTATVALSTTDLARVLSVRASTPAGAAPLDWMPAQDLRDLAEMNTSPGEPEYWTVVNGGTLQLFPTPAAVYTLSVVYTSFPAALSADSDVMVIPRGHEDAVVWAAIVSMAFRQRDYYALNAAKQEAREAMKSMVDAFGKDQAQTSRIVQHWAGWDALG